MAQSAKLTQMYEGDELPAEYQELMENYSPRESDLTTANEPKVIPIEQVTPQKLRANLMGMPINVFGDFMPYWHFYPEIIGYDRRGNGHVDGDATYFVLSSVTNAHGVGCIHVEFPPKRNSVDRDSNGGPLGAFDGIFHVDNRPHLRGYDVYIIPEDIEVNFGAAFGPRYSDQIAIVPATLLGLDVMYNAPANTRCDFLVQRRVIWGERAYDLPKGPSAPPLPPKNPVNDEL